MTEFVALTPKHIVIQWRMVIVIKKLKEQKVYNKKICLIIIKIVY